VDQQVFVQLLPPAECLIAAWLVAVQFLGVVLLNINFAILFGKISEGIYSEVKISSHFRLLWSFFNVRDRSIARIFLRA